MDISWPLFERLRAAGHNELLGLLADCDFGCPRFVRLLSRWRPPIHEAPAAIDRYLAGDEPWPAKETTNADQ